jgi:hypothetical protein
MIGPCDDGLMPELAAEDNTTGLTILDCFPGSLGNGISAFVEFDVVESGSRSVYRLGRFPESAAAARGCALSTGGLHQDRVADFPRWMSKELPTSCRKVVSRSLPATLDRYHHGSAGHVAIPNRSIRACEPLDAEVSVCFQDALSQHRLLAFNFA